MPYLQELLFMFFNKALNVPNLMGTESPARLKTYRI